MHIQLQMTLQGGSPYFSSQNHLGFPLIELTWKPEDFDVIHKSAACEQKPRWRCEGSGFEGANGSYLA